MKIVLRTLDEEIVLKKYNSYLDLDKVLTTFHNNEEILAKLNLDEETSEIVVLDNHDREMEYNTDILKKTLAYYTSGKGEEFISWIFDATADSKLGSLNTSKLLQYFIIKSNDFTKGDANFDANNINNPAGQILFSLIGKIKEELNMYNVSPETYEKNRNKIEPFINEYVKRNGEYDYAAMRKFANTLAVDIYYQFGKTDIKVKEATEEEQETILKDFENTIRKHFNQTVEESIEQETTYDENGIKNEEKEFLEEFNKKLKL